MEEKETKCAQCGNTIIRFPYGWYKIMELRFDSAHCLVEYRKSHKIPTDVEITRYIEYKEGDHERIERERRNAGWIVVGMALLLLPLGYILWGGILGSIILFIPCFVLGVLIYAHTESTVQWWNV